MRKLLLPFLIVTSFFLAGFASAKGIALHAKPDDKSQVVATVTNKSHLVTIIKKGNWRKVGDQISGTVGWVRNKTLHNRTVIKESKKDNKGNRHYSITEYEGTEQLSEKQLRTMLEDMQKQQWRMDQDMRQMLRMMRRNFDEMRFGSQSRDYHGDSPRMQDDQDEERTLYEGQRKIS